MKTPEEAKKVAETLRKTAIEVGGKSKSIKFTVLQGLLISMLPYDVMR